MRVHHRYPFRYRDGPNVCSYSYCTQSREAYLVAHDKLMIKAALYIPSITLRPIVLASDGVYITPYKTVQ